jgi:MFS family permease
MISPIVGTGMLSAGFLLGSLPPSLRAVGPRWGESLGWDAAESDRRLRRGLLFPTVILLPLAGWLGDWWGPKELTLVGLLAVAIGLGLLAILPQPKTSSTNLLGIAVGIAFLAVGLIAWMPTTLGETGRAVEGLNLGFIAISLGWLTGPQTLRKTVAAIGVRGTFLAGAVAALACLLMLAVADDAARNVGGREVLLHDLRFWLLLLAALLYFPIESCLEHWSGPFLSDLGNLRYLRSRIFGFWCAFLLARLAMFMLVRTGFEPWVLLTCTAVSAMVLGNLVGAYGPSSGGFGFWLVGFCYGPLLPGFLGLFAQSFPDRFGTILGILLALGATYNAVLGPILHRYALSRTPRDAMRVPVVLTLLLAAPLLLVTLMR